MEIGLRIDGFRGEAYVGDALLGTADLRPLSPGGIGSFLGCWVGPFAVGDGHVDVDCFQMHAVD